MGRTEEKKHGGEGNAGIFVDAHVIQCNSIVFPFYV